MVSVLKNILCVVMLACCLFFVTSSPLKPSPILDRINVDQYLANKRAVQQQIKCILKNGPCDSVGKEIKRLMPAVVKDESVCDECTPSQLEKIQKIINHLKTNYPTEWAEGTAKFGEPKGL